MDHVLERLGGNLLFLRREQERFSHLGYLPPAYLDDSFDVLPPSLSLAPPQRQTSSSVSEDPSTESLHLYNLRLEECVGLCATLALHAAVFRRPVFITVEKREGGGDDGESRVAGEGWRELCHVLEVPSELVDAHAAAAGPGFGAEYAQTIYAAQVGGDSGEQAPIYPLADGDVRTPLSQVCRRYRPPCCLRLCSESHSKSRDLSLLKGEKRFECIESSEPNDEFFCRT